MSNLIQKKNLIFYIIASLVFPNIFSFYLFNNNKARNNLYFNHFIMLSIILAIFSLLIYLLYSKITRSNEGAMVVLFVSWLFFWSFENINKWLDITYGRFYLTFGFIIILSILLIILRLFYVGLSKSYEFFTIISILVCGFFCFNFGKACYTEINITKFDRPFEIKKEFMVDDSLPNPDIYWFHMDSMMGFNTIEKFFGDSQDDLKTELLNRGFVINSEAMSPATGTLYAIPAFTSPSFYDSYLGIHLQEQAHLSCSAHWDMMYNILSRDGINIDDDIAPYLELFHAFIKKGYNKIAIAEYVGYGILPLNYFYRTYGTDRKEQTNLLLIKSTNENVHTTSFKYRVRGLIQLLTKTTPLSIEPVRMMIHSIFFGSTEENWFLIPTHDDIVNSLLIDSFALTDEIYLYRKLYDSFSIPSPKLLWISNDIAHSPWCKMYTDLNPELKPDDLYNVDKYYLPIHRYAVNVMLKTIDMVLEHNSDAIIILQGDHGIGEYPFHDYLKQAGYTQAERIEMNLSVISAVRIPSKYGGLDEPIDPVNIARLLVNRFVGENYEMVNR